MVSLKDKLQIAYDDVPNNCPLYKYYEKEEVEEAVLEFLKLLKSTSFCKCGYESECFLCRKYKEIFGNF